MRNLILLSSRKQLKGRRNNTMATISRRKLAEHAVERIVRGDAVDAVIREMAAFLIDTGRKREAELVVRAIETALLSRGTALVTVTTARTLSDTAKQDVERFVKSQYEGVKSVIIRELIDETVLAGIKISLPDAQLDATAKTKLEKLVVA